MVTAEQLPEWLRRLYPFRPQSFVTPLGARMSFVDEGPRTDEAVLMLHGNPTWSFFYRDLIGRLASRLRCIAPDHVGMGLSDKPQDYPYTLATRIADISALVDHLGLTKVHLVVHDWGGAIGMGWAGQHPELVGRIVVLNTAAFRSTRIPARIALCRSRVPGTLLVRGFNGFAGPAVWMAMHRRRLSHEERRGYLFPYGTWAERVAVDAFVKDIPLSADHRSYAALAAVESGLDQLREKPMRIVWGEDDFCFDEHFLRAWQGKFPRAEIFRLGGAGHYVLDDAQPEAAERVAEFCCPMK